MDIRRQVVLGHYHTSRIDATIAKMMLEEIRANMETIETLLCGDKNDSEQETEKFKVLGEQLQAQFNQIADDINRMNNLAQTAESTTSSGNNKKIKFNEKIDKESIARRGSSGVSPRHPTYVPSTYTVHEYNPKAEPLKSVLKKESPPKGGSSSPNFFANKKKTSQPSLEPSSKSQYN